MYLYAKQDGLYISTMDRIISVKRRIPYDAITEIYIEEGCEYDGYDSYFDKEPIDKYYPKHNAVPETIIILFNDENGKKKRLRLEMSGIMAPHNTEDLNHYSLLKNNIFEYIVPKMNNCTMYKYGYGKQLSSAIPYPKQP